MKYHYELAKEGVIVLCIMIGFLFLCLLGIIGYQIYLYVRDNKKKKVIKHKKKISYEEYEDLQGSNISHIKYLEDENCRLRQQREEMYCIIRAVKDYHINLQELEDLGLQRYNAKYGKKGSYMYEPFYEVLFKNHILERKERYENKNSK